MSDSSSSSSKPQDTNKDKNSTPVKTETFFESLARIDKELEQKGFNRLMHTYDFAKKTYENVSTIYEKLSTELSPVKIEKDIMNISEKINKDYIYSSMLLRTHGDAIKIASVVIPGFFCSFLGRRMFMFGATTGYVMSSTAIFLAEYKWNKK